MLKKIRKIKILHSNKQKTRKTLIYCTNSYFNHFYYWILNKWKKCMSYAIPILQILKCTLVVAFSG